MDLTQWSPLAGVVLGGLISSAVTWLNNRNAGKRDDARWERERSRDRETQVLEQQLLTYDHRRAAYAGFLEAWTTMAEAVTLRHIKGGEPPRDQDLKPVREQRALVQLYGRQQAVERAEVAYNMLGRWAWPRAAESEKVTLREVFASIEEFRAVVRRDLAIPD
jgi:hypothetical protein